jgi:hypothetical protein
MELPRELVPVVRLGQNEQVINVWRGTGDGPSDGGWKLDWDGTEFLVLTNFRILLAEHQVLRRGLMRTDWRWAITLDRDLRSIPAPGVRKGTVDDAAVVVAGRSFRLTGDPQPAADEIGYARGRLLPADAVGEPGSAPSGSPPVVIKEVVKVRCGYSGSLNHETERKCGVCGAPVGAR